MKGLILDQSTINLLIAAIFAALGWFARTLWYAQGKLRTDLTNLQVHIATNYVSRDTLEKILEDLKDDLHYIRERVDAIPQNRRAEDKQ